MYYIGITLAAVVMMIFLSLPAAYSEKSVNVVVLLYAPSSCNIDFDDDFWARYDAAMAAEWGISSQTICIEGLAEKEWIDLQTSIQDAGLNVIVMSSENAIIDSLNEEADGLAQPSNNFGAVEFNYNETTKTLSHETLHLALEEMGHSRSCYVDAVHENAHRYARYYDNVMIMAHFDC